MYRQNGMKHSWMFDEKMNFVKESVVKHLFTFHNQIVYICIPPSEANALRYFRISSNIPSSVHELIKALNKAWALTFTSVISICLQGDAYVTSTLGGGRW